MSMYAYPLDVAPEPPGLATITRCPDGPCYECEQTGRIVWKACPRCGFSGWRYRDGRSERQGMFCEDPACGFSWTAEHPGWIAQRLPGSPPPA